MRLRILTDLFRQKFVRKTLKYTKYSCGFPPFSDEKSLVRLSCRFVRYCPKSDCLNAGDGTASISGVSLRHLGKGIDKTVKIC